MQAPDLERPNPYRDPRTRPPKAFTIDLSSGCLLALGFGFAALPFIQLVLTGDASQTDLGVSVVLLFLAVGLVR